MASIKDQLAAVRQMNGRLEDALLAGAHAKKAVVTQQYADGLYVDINGETYKRYPHTIHFNTSGVTTRGSTAGSTVYILEYAVKDGGELQLIPTEPNNFIPGTLKQGSPALPTAEAYESALEGWDTMGRVFRGLIWTGTVPDVNNSDNMRQYGHPLVFNGDAEVRLIGGDLLRFSVNTPSGGSTITVANSALVIHCYSLSRIKHG